MPSHNPGDLAKRLQAKESAAATAVYERYIERLIALARGRLSAKLRRRVDADDIAQSAFRSFFVHAREDAYEFEHSGDLWRLLAQITLHKLYRVAEHHQAKRRSVHAEANRSGTFSTAIAAEPTPAEAVALAEQLHLVTQSLTHVEQRVITHRLAGSGIEEIAALVGKSPRTVRRVLATLQTRFERELANGATGENAARIERLNREVQHRVKLQAGDFVLERLIGVGGMGKIYQARVRDNGQVVAVKSLRKLHQADPAAVAQFVQEAEILETLQHPNVIRVRGLGQFPGGGLFIVMEYVAGPNLQERLRQGPIEVQQAITIVRQVAVAVGRAHKMGIVHADLKPANILMDGPSRVVVTDFGFAQFLHADTMHPSSRIGGTIGFMAPEVVQLRQRPTIAADIFGLGALLWTLVTGSQPSRNAEQCGPIDAIAQIWPVCRKCMVEHPHDRFQAVGDFLRALPEDAV